MKLVFQRRGGRPSSAPSSRHSGKKLTDVGQGPVLYKVFVTTADKKGASTDAKVIRQEHEFSDPQCCFGSMSFFCNFLSTQLHIYFSKTSQMLLGLVKLLSTNMVHHHFNLFI